MSGYQIIDIGSHEFDSEGNLSGDGDTLKVNGIYEAIEGSIKPIVLNGEITTEDTGYFSRIKLPCFVTPYLKNGNYILPLVSYGKGEFDYVYTYLEITSDDEVMLVQDHAI